MLDVSRRQRFPVKIHVAKRHNKSPSYLITCHGIRHRVTLSSSNLNRNFADSEPIPRQASNRSGSGRHNLFRNWNYRADSSLFADPPEVRVAHGWVNSAEGMEAKLHCIVDADPPAEVRNDFD